jgi:hypothetical protein
VYRQMKLFLRAKNTLSLSDERYRLPKVIFNSQLLF